MMGGEVFESVDSEVHAESRDSQEMALRTADKLLKELRPKQGQQMASYQLLQARNYSKAFLICLFELSGDASTGDEEQGEH